MAIKINGEERKYKLLHNGVELDKGYHNGEVLVYNKATPYYVNFTDYPIKMTHSQGGSIPDELGMETTSNGYKIEAKKYSGTGYHAGITAAVDLPTKGCNKVRVKYTLSDTSSANICGNVIANGFVEGTISGQLIMDCVGDTFNLNFSVGDATEWYWATLRITEIYFYYE